MRTLYAPALVATAALGIVCIASLAQQASQTLPQQTQADLAIGHLALSKSGRGLIEPEQATNYQATVNGKKVEMTRLNISPSLLMTSAGKNDETNDLLNSRLDIRVELVGRSGDKEGFGTATGTFTWSDRGSKLIGTVIGTVGLTAEHGASASNRAPDHLAATLVGVFTDGKLKGSSVTAQMAGTLTFKGRDSTLQATLDGVLSNAPPAQPGSPATNSQPAPSQPQATQPGINVAPASPTVKK